MVTGGGTGGHAFPAVAVIEELQRRDPRLSVQWVGRAGAIEERICKARSIAFRSLPVEGWPRRMGLRKLWVTVKMAWSLCKAILYIRTFQPDAVLGVGGYVSLPVVYAAQRMGLPTFLHEQNLRLGVANQLLARRASRIFLSFTNTMGQFPAERSEVTGNPVRSDFISPPSMAEARDALGLRQDVPVLLVYGGSQGAGSINRVIMECLPRFKRDELQIVWGTGTQDAAVARQAADSAPVPVHVFAFIDTMAVACSAADLVVCRSGASGTAELACLGKPSILIPYPHATDNHQEHNARALERAGAAMLMLESECSAEALQTAIRRLLGNQESLHLMGHCARQIAHPNAADLIVEAILSTVFDKVAKPT